MVKKILVNYCIFFWSLTSNWSQRNFTPHQVNFYKFQLWLEPGHGMQRELVFLCLFCGAGDQAGKCSITQRYIQPSSSYTEGINSSPFGKQRYQPYISLHDQHLSFLGHGIRCKNVLVRKQGLANLYILLNSVKKDKMYLK